MICLADDAIRAEWSQSLSSSIIDKVFNGQPRVIASGDHVGERHLDEAKETAETKGELSREDVA